MSPPQTFYPFPNLPLELRLRIWTFAFPPPQLTSLIAYTEEETSSLLPPPSLSFSPKTSQSYLYTYLERCSTISVPTPHALLHINAESRNLILSSYYLLPFNPNPEIITETKPTALETEIWELEFFPSRPLEPGKLRESNKGFADKLTPYTLFNPRTDILFLADPPQDQSHTTYSSLSVLPRWLPSSLLSSIHYLAISYYTWRKDRKFNLLPLLYAFTSLERLYICFVGSGTESERSGEGRGGWLDAVRLDGREEEDGMLKQVEREVLEDVEELGRKAEGMWDKPVVKVVKDRGAAVADWKDNCDGV